MRCFWKCGEVDSSDYLGDWVFSCVCEVNILNDAWRLVEKGEEQYIYTLQYLIELLYVSKLLSIVHFLAPENGGSAAIRRALWLSDRSENSMDALVEFLGRTPDNKPFVDYISGVTFEAGKKAGFAGSWKNI